MKEQEPFCTGCKKFAYELTEYIELAKMEETTPQQEAMWDGTYNPHNGHFLCTSCYIKAGMPATSYGWTAP